jgi:hypothetical protein
MVILILQGEAYNTVACNVETTVMKKMKGLLAAGWGCKRGWRQLVTLQAPGVHVHGMRELRRWGDVPVRPWVVRHLVHQQQE